MREGLSLFPFQDVYELQRLFVTRIIITHECWTRRQALLRIRRQNHAHRLLLGGGAGAPLCGDNNTFRGDVKIRNLVSNRCNVPFCISLVKLRRFLTDGRTRNWLGQFRANDSRILPVEVSRDLMQTFDDTLYISVTILRLRRALHYGWRRIKPLYITDTWKANYL